MINSLLLKSIITKKGYTQSEVAKKIGISSQTFNSKINNKTEFKLNEVILLCKFLDTTLQEKEEIFFGN